MSRKFFSCAAAAFAVLCVHLPADAGEKQTVTTLLSATVWPSGYSEVEWYVGGQRHRAISTIDFSLLDPALSFETATTRFAFLILATRQNATAVQQAQQAGTANEQGHPRRWPAQLPARDGAAQYLTGWDADTPAADEESAYAAMDALHDYFDANRAQVIAEAEDRRARAAQEAQQRASTPRRVRVGPPVVFKRLEAAPAVPPARKPPFAR